MSGIRDWRLIKRVGAEARFTGGWRIDTSAVVNYIDSCVVQHIGLPGPGDTVSVPGDAGILNALLSIIGHADYSTMHSVSPMHKFSVAVACEAFNQWLDAFDEHMTNAIANTDLQQLEAAGTLLLTIAGDREKAQKGGA